MSASSQFAARFIAIPLNTFRARAILAQKIILYYFGISIILNSIVNSSFIAFSQWISEMRYLKAIQIWIKIKFTRVRRRWMGFWGGRGGRFRGASMLRREEKSIEWNENEQQNGTENEKLKRVRRFTSLKHQEWIKQIKIYFHRAFIFGGSHEHTQLSAGLCRTKSSR